MCAYVNAYSKISLSFAHCRFIQSENMQNNFEKYNRFAANIQHAFCMDDLPITSSSTQDACRPSLNSLNACMHTETHPNAHSLKCLM